MLIETDNCGVCELQSRSVEFDLDPGSVKLRIYSFLVAENLLPLKAVMKLKMIVLAHHSG
jgi:hypothetical protein